MYLLRTYDWNDGEPTKAPKINYRGLGYYKEPCLALKQRITKEYRHELLMPYLDANSTENS